MSMPPLSNVLPVETRRIPRIAFEEGSELHNAVNEYNGTKHLYPKANKAENDIMEERLRVAHSTNSTIETALAKGDLYGRNNAPHIIRIAVSTAAGAAISAAASGSPLFSLGMGAVTLLSATIGGVTVTIGKEDGCVAKIMSLAGFLIPTLIFAAIVPDRKIDMLLCNTVAAVGTLAIFGKMAAGFGLGGAVGYLSTVINHAPPSRVVGTVILGSLYGGCLLSLIALVGEELGKTAKARAFVGSLTGKVMALQTAISNRSCRMPGLY